jgi:undecaprenyl-diphosphatase
MNFLHLILLGLLQGLTEFLPISSSAHLILLPLIAEWQDQGLALDIAAHIGTLFAVIIYFRIDIKNIISNGVKSAPWHDNNINARLFWFMCLATIPVSVVGLSLHDFISEYFRNPLIIAAATIFFGILLWWADVKGKQDRDDETLCLKDIIWIALAQVLALIPGTSRSGITITAGLMLGLNRKTAARFSFLLSIPVIFLAGCYETLLLIRAGESTDVVYFAIVFIFSWLAAWLTISLFLRFIEKTGMLPYVIYRLLLGTILLYLFL